MEMLSHYTLFPNSIISTILYFLLALLFATVAFGILHKFKPSKLSQNLVERTNSWWVIISLYIITFGINLELSFGLLALLSFIAQRELISRLDFKLEQRRIVLWSYLFIPFQYYFAYMGALIPFLVFIPVGGLLIFPLRTILNDNPSDSLKIYAKLHWSILLTTYSISHIAFFMGLPLIPGEGHSYQFFIFFLIFVSQTNDIFQYISGKIFGRKKLTPNTSPNKTIAGAIGGVLGSLCLGYIFHFFMPLSLIQTLISAFALSVFGLLGDLSISSIKRDLNIKDMSQFIPGHGGILDRIDSLIFTSMIFFYLVYYWIYQ